MVLGMAVLNAATRQLVESGALAHLVTMDADGSPQVAVVWVGLDGDELVAAHLDGRQRKLANIRRDPRVAVSFEAAASNEIGMRHYLVVYGQARISEGGSRAAAPARADLRWGWHRVPADARAAAGVCHPHQPHPGQRSRSLDRLSCADQAHRRS